MFLVPPQKAPTILATRRTYGIGERIQLTCNSAPSRPVPRMKWFINDIPVPESYIRSNDSEKNQATTESISCTEMSNHSQESPGKDDSEQTNGVSPVGVQTGHLSSRLDFVLREEHLTENGHFTVRCMSFLDAQFYPEGRCGCARLLMRCNHSD